MTYSTSMKRHVKLRQRKRQAGPSHTPFDPTPRRLPLKEIQLLVHGDILIHVEIDIVQKIRRFLHVLHPVHIQGKPAALSLH